MARMVDDLLDLTRTRLGSGIPITPLQMDLKTCARSCSRSSRPSTRTGSWSSIPTETCGASGTRAASARSCRTSWATRCSTGTRQARPGDRQDRTPGGRPRGPQRGHSHSPRAPREHLRAHGEPRPAGRGDEDDQPGVGTAHRPGDRAGARRNPGRDLRRRGDHLHRPPSAPLLPHPCACGASRGPRRPRRGRGARRPERLQNEEEPS